ncbi:MAG: hypothetical protein NVSMB14_12590 [Isosphaeraceae bacterium]
MIQKMIQCACGFRPRTRVLMMVALIALIAFGTIRALWARQDMPMKMPMASPRAQAKGNVARAAILAHQQALKAEKMYSCCIRPGCSMCSTDADMCPCRMNLAKKQPVCPECWGGWYAGKGDMPEVEPGPNASNLRVLPKAKMQIMYDMKEMKIDALGKPAREGS